ncbi:MAG: GlsB/YeaQ/YmgE family stress response membrane protein [Myxococcaceae bacterium]|nr:GlsB/YeaQ/YmgE family stress response membrane protein [Myxococcaceae bacterium]
MSILVFLVIGFIAGLVARALVPGNQSMGLLGTTLLGIVGSFVGGLLSSAIYSRGSWLDIHPTGILFSILGSILLLGLISFAGRGGRGLRA